MFLGDKLVSSDDRTTFIDNLKAQIACHLQLTVNQVTDTQVLQALLLDMPGVEDCAILSRQPISGQTVLIAYVVSSEPLTLERLRVHLQSVLPADWNSECLPHIYVPVSTLPLTAMGSVDNAALAQLPVLEDALVETWERQLNAIATIDQAAVLIQPYAGEETTVHLADLVPHWGLMSAVEPDRQTEVLDSPQTEDPQSQPQAMALRYGGDLPPDLAESNTLPALLIRAAQKPGKRIRYLQADGSVLSYAYADLLVEAERLLAGLRQQGLQPQDKVIFQLELNQDIIPAFWACILGGFIPVIMEIAPTYQDANGVVDKLCNIWKLIDQPLILTTSALQDSVQGLTQWLPAGELQVAAIEVLRSNQPDSAHHDCQPDDLTFFNLTSGSTGMPKCIGLTHWNLISRAKGTNLLCNHRQEDVILNWLPFDHIGSISDWHIRCVDLACNLVYVSKEYILGRPLNWIDLLDRYRISHSWAPNFAYALVNDGLKQNEVQTWDLSCVQSLLTAGEAVSSKAVEDFIVNLSPYGFKKTAVRPAFGMAEMGSGITYFQPTEEQPLLRHVVDKASLSGDGPLRRVDGDHPNCSMFTDLGPVIPGVSMRIVNAQNEVLHEDTVGFLQVKGDAVSPGYFKNPDVNKEVFLADGWFNTGDLGFISKGQLVVSGRAKETIIINGANYYNHEIEAVVEAIEGIEVSYTAACAVKEGRGATEKLAIFFHAEATDDQALTQLIRQVRQTVVSKIALNPDYLIPVEKTEVPKTAIGKIQRSQLTQRFEVGEFDPLVKRVDCLLKNANTLPNWFFRKTWVAKQATVTAPASPGPILIFQDERGTGQQLSATLENLGQTCIHIYPGADFQQISDSRYQLNPAEPEDYQQLVRSVVNTQGATLRILHLWALAETTISSEVVNQEQRDKWLYSVLFTLQALAAEGGPHQSAQFFIVGNGVQKVEEDDAVTAQKATVLGLIKAAVQEFEWLDCRHIDLAEGTIEQHSNWLRQELFVRQFEQEVAYRHSKRWVPRLEEVYWPDLSSQKIPFKTGGFYLISGGLGGVGSAIAQYLLENFEVKLLLLGRTPLPELHTENAVMSSSAGDNPTLTDRVRTYQMLSQKGEVQYEAVDLVDADQLEQLVQALENRWQQPMDGVLHLAGVASGRLIVDETQESFAATLSPKLEGTLALQKLLVRRPDSLFINFSSVNGFFGGNQTSAYAAANSFADAFHHELQSQRGLDAQMNSYCLAWSMWDDMGMSQGFLMKEFSRIQGYYAMPPSQAIQSMVGCLSHPLDQVWIGLDCTKRNVQRYIIQSYTQRPTEQLQTLDAFLTTPKDSAPWAPVQVEDRFGTLSKCIVHLLDQMPYTATGEIDRDQLASLTRGSSQQIKPRTDLEQQLAQLWQDILGIPSVGVEDSFFELGGSSLQAARLFAAINETFGKNLPLTTLFTAQTVEKLASLLSTETEDAQWSPLVPVKPTGSQQPLFCIHGAGGNILMYRELAAYVDKDQPLYGLQAVGLDGGPMITRLQEMAEVYISHMRTFQPEGPYLLMGLSVGGMIAVEMAHQLRQQGQEVAFLGMIDALGPGYPKLMPVFPRLVSLVPFVLSKKVLQIPSILRKKLLQKLDQPNPDNLQEDKTPTLPAPAIANITEPNTAEPNITKPKTGEPKIAEPTTPLIPQAGSIGDWFENLSLSIIKYSPWAFVVPRFYLDSGLSMPDSFQKVQEATVKAFLNYNPEPYHGKITLFRATQQPRGCYSDPTLGWSQVTEDLEIYDIPGHHGESLLYEKESLDALGPQLNACLEQAHLNVSYPQK